MSALGRKQPINENPLRPKNAPRRRSIHWRKSPCYPPTCVPIANSRTPMAARAITGESQMGRMFFRIEQHQEFRLKQIGRHGGDGVQDRVPLGH